MAAATGLAAAMVLSMGVPVFAEDTKTVVTSAGSATISKDLYTAQNANITSPATTYTFNFENLNKKTVNDEEVTDTDINISAKTAKDNGTTSSGGKVTLTSDALLTDTEKTAIANKGVGIYTYVLTEANNPTATGVIVNPTAGSEGDKNLYTDSTAYLIRIKVSNDSSGNHISGITAEKFASASAAKAASTATEANKATTITFNNKYTQYADTEGGTPNSSKGLTVSKTVSGTGSDPNKEFTYTITFTEDATAYADANTGITEHTTTKVNDGLKLSASAAVTNKSSNATVAANADLSYGTEYTFTLKSGGSIDFKLPAGTQYKITETGESGYTASYKVNSGSDVKGTAGNDITAGDDSSKLYVTTGANTVDFTNTYNDVSLTGVVNQYGGLLVIVAIAAAGLVVISIRRRREA